MDEEINIKEFLKERNDEINELLNSLDRKRKTLEFQRLPFYKRRRTKSLFKKKKHSKKSKHKAYWLPMHVYYAKRFKMMELNNFKIPLLRRQKSDKFIYKSAHRGFLFDEGFMGIQIHSINEFPELINSKENIFIDYIINDQPVSYCRNHESVIIQSPEYSNEYSVLSIFYGRTLPIGKYNLNDFDKNFQKDDSLNNKISTFILSNQKEYTEIFSIGEDEEAFHIFPTEQTFKYKFIFKKNIMKSICNMFLRKGYIPISINELFRLSIEGNFCLNFDFTNTNFFEKFEHAIYGEEYKKYKRTPKGKRKNYISMGFDQPFILNVNYPETHIFELEKGTFERGSLIYENGVLCGIVIRGAYCFSQGREKGIIAMNKYNSFSNYTLKSIKNGKIYVIRKINNQNTTNI